MALKTCSSCIFLKSIPIADPNQGSVTVNACVVSPPPSDQSTAQGIASWPVISDPTNWSCGAGIDAATGISFSPNPLSTTLTGATLQYGLVSPLPLQAKVLSKLSSGFFHVRELSLKISSFTCAFSAAGGQTMQQVIGGFYDFTTNQRLVPFNEGIVNTAATVTRSDVSAFDISGDIKLDAPHDYGFQIDSLDRSGDLSVTSSTFFGTIVCFASYFTSNV